MPFPNTPRVIYKKNPLDNVICQIKFPTILSIETDLPSAFQSAIRKEFPLFNEKTEFQIQIQQGNDPKILSKFMESIPPRTEKKNFEFFSDDNIWKINLTRNFIALSCSQYSKWEEFSEKFQKPLETLIKLYEPEYFLRIGLRYINAINRSNLNLANEPWANLLKPHISGVLQTSEVADNITDYQSTTEILLRDEFDGKVRLVTGFVQSLNTGEQSFLIDTDYFTNNKTNISSAFDVLNSFNRKSGRLLHWCITDLLHTAMEPEEV